MAKILVIDDEAGVRQLLTLVLKMGGHSVISAEDGETGLELASREDAHLAFVDIHLPGLDGLDVMQRLRKSKPELRLVATTGGSSDLRLEQACARPSGPDAVLTKPFKKQDLLDMVDRVLSPKGDA